MPKRKPADQLSLLDDLFAEDSDEPKVDLSWMYTCNQCRLGGHDCNMPFCRCLTCGGGWRE